MSDTILIVDDSVSMRQMTSMILKGGGYQVLEASGGDEALKQLSNDVKVVITDYNMPGMNGVELIRAIRSGSTNKSVPILMLTTESEEAKKNEGRDAGATAWITKPFEKDTLLKTIKKISGEVSF